MKSEVSDLYILGGEDGHTPILVEDLLEWGKWQELNDRQICGQRVGPYGILTTFLAVNSRPESPPLLFETIVFHEDEPSYDLDMTRCSTWDEAIMQHQRLVEEISDRLDSGLLPEQRAPRVARFRGFDCSRIKAAMHESDNELNGDLPQ